MRILLLNQFYVPDISPTAHLAESLARDRATRGDLVTVVAGCGSYVGIKDRARQETTNPKIYRIWTPNLGKKSLARQFAGYALFYLGAALRVLTLPRQDIVVSMTTPPYIALIGLFHKLVHPGTRLVLWNMDCYPDMAELGGLFRRGGVTSRLLRWLNLKLFRRLDHLVCLDIAMVDLLCSQYATRHGPPTSVIPNWEPRNLYPGPITTGPRASRCLKILYLGNTGRGHEFDTVLEAAHALHKDPVEIQFYGGGSRWKAIEEKRRDRGLTNLTLYGYIPKHETPAVMREADCALITLRPDALGLMSPSKLHANLAMGLPIVYVGPAGSNVDEAISRFACGVSLRNGDVAGLVAAVRLFLTQPDRLAELSRQARAAFDEAYSDECALPRFDFILAGLNVSATSDQRGSMCNYAN